MDSELTINAVTPEFIKACSLDISSLNNLAIGTLGINVLGGPFSWPLVYIIIRVQVEGVWGYDEDQVALDVPDSTIFGSWVPVTLGTPTINHIIKVIKESKINELVASLHGLRIAQLLACCQGELSVQNKAADSQTVDLTNLNKAVRITKKEEIDAFSSKIIHGQMKTMLLGNNMHVMTQSVKGVDGPHLPHGLSVVKMYNEVTSRSKHIGEVLKNLTAILVTIAKGMNVTQVVAANAVPQVEVAPRPLEELDEVQGIQQTKMLVERTREVFFQQLDLSGLEKLSEGNQVVTYDLLAEYHDIFSLEPRELGCTDLAKHEISVVDDKPLKEWFWRIPPYMVDEALAHVKEMLEAGAICPSQSPWCNAWVLVHKKDRGLHFCIDFHKLNARTKKNSSLLPWIQEAIESLVGVGYFSCLDLKVGFFGKLQWTRHQSSTLLSSWET